MVQLLQMPQLADEQLDYLRHLDNSAQSLLSIVNDLLDLTQIEAGGFGIEQADFQPDQLAEDIIRIHELVAQRKGVSLRLELAPNLPCVLCGIQVTAVEDGRQALEAWEQEPYDLILMDVQMPGIDGIAATTVIRMREHDTRQHIPIITLTAHTLSGDRGKLMEHGFDGYVPKPIDVEGLLSEIGRLLNGQTR